MKAIVKKENAFDKGRGFVEYALNTDGAEIIGGNSTNPLTPQGVRHVLFVMPQDGHCHISNERWLVAAREYLDKNGLDPKCHRWMLIRHPDIYSEHVHLIIAPPHEGES